jgi:homoserine O-acetyltransferase
MERAAAAIRAQMLIVVSEHDEAVNPAPALELARLTHAQVVTLDGRCGHQATRCEREVMWSAVRQFLAQ